MNSFIKRFLFITGFIAAIVVAGCTDDIADEITELNTTRLFSPTDLDVRVVNQTSARLTWKPVRNADSYTVDFFENSELDFSGTPARTVSNVIMDQLPLIVPGFAGETGYSVRVKAVGTDISESKYITATFTTSAEQIFLTPIDPNDIGATTAILRWQPGQQVTHIIITPGDITHTITSAEAEAGFAEITGLTGETEYSAHLMNDDKVRGRVTFTTNIDIGDAILVNPGDDLKALIEAADEGDVFALMPGDYQIDGNIVITTSVGIVGVYPANRPILQGANLRMNAGAGLRLKDIIFDGTTAPDGNQTIVYDEVLPAGQTYGDVVIEDCLIRNYVKGVFYASIAVLIESVTITGTIYHNIQCSGGDFIDFRQGMTKKFEFRNNTVYNSAHDRDIFRMDAGGSTNFPAETAILTIHNNTFYNVVGVNTRRILYIRLASHEISVVKNIFAETAANYSNNSATRVTEMTGNNYFNAPNLTSVDFTVHDSGNYTTLNPGFADPENGNFTVSNDDLILFGIGDPRWLP